MCVPYICMHLHPELIRNAKATRFNDTLFTVTWTSSDPSYSYTVIWINLNTGVMDNYTVAENTNSYTVTGLNNATYYVRVTATGVCGTRTSDPILVNGECNELVCTS